VKRYPSMRTWLLSFLDTFLSQKQRQAPPDERSRYRVLVGAALLNLFINLALLVADGDEPQLAGTRLILVLCGSVYLAIVILVRKAASPRLPALILCSLLGVGAVASTLSMGTQRAATHMAMTVVPTLAIYLLGARLGFLFTVLIGANALFLHPLYMAGFDLQRPLFPDELASMFARAAAFALLANWVLNGLYSATREEAHTALEKALQTSRESQGQLLSLFESTDDLVCSLDAQGRLLTANSAVRGLFVRLSGRPLQPGEPLPLEALPAEWRSQWEQTLGQVLSGQRVRQEANLALEGQTRTLDLTFSPVLPLEGRPVGLTLFGRDITPRKEAEARLSEMHRNLLDVSRQAGMSEVATSILHNIGNMLTSVNVSVGLLYERIKQLRISGLAKVGQLLESKSTETGTLCMEGAQGSMLLRYVKGLSEELSQDRNGLEEEVRTLSQGVERINGMVSMQQELARVSTVVEPVAVPQIINDALRLQAVSFEQQGIQVKREYEDIPITHLDRHLLLQILLNLLTNAQHALQVSGRPDKQLTVRVSLAGEQRLRIEVADNGMGIAPEHFRRLFNQGFTTKKEGHGFGLHSSALAARDMQGTLNCASEGPGRGATFTLELPLSTSPVAVPSDVAGQTPPSGTP
jgi:two-component system sensor kinase FixL